MFILGKQLSSQQYQAFRQSLATQLPTLRVQTINAGGKFAINGNVTAEETAAIHAIYDTHRTETVDSGFDMLAHQMVERRRQQTQPARAMRVARALRFAK